MVSDIEEPTDHQEDGTDDSTTDDAGASERPKERTIGLLSLFGFLASGLSLFTDIGISDAAAATTTGVGGVIATLLAAAIIFRRRTANAARAETLREVRQKIDGLIKAEEARQDVDHHLITELKTLAEGLGEPRTERRSSARTGWLQAWVGIAFTIAVSVLVIVFGRFIPVVK
jgi:hypothetical protein